MEVDLAAEVIRESMKRMMNECLECLKLKDEPAFDPLQSIADLEHEREIVALQKVLTRIDETIDQN